METPPHKTPTPEYGGRDPNPPRIDAPGV